MKLRGTQVLVALLAVLLGAVVAVAQSGGDGGSNGAGNAAAGFRDYERADADQYGLTSTVTTPGQTTTVTVGAGPSEAPAQGAQAGQPTTANAPVGAAGDDDGDGDTKPASAEDDGGTAPASANGGAGEAGGTAGAGAAGVARGTSSTDPDCGGGNPRQFGNGGSVAYIGLSPARYRTLTEVRKVTGPPAYLAELYEPIDTAAVARLTAGTKWAGAADDLDELAAYAEALGRSVVDGGALAKAGLPLLSRGVLPTDVKPLSGVILTHCEVPLRDRPDQIRDTFVEAFVGALRDAQVPSVERGEEVPLPVIGVERTDSDDRTVPYYEKFGISTLDHVDTRQGKLALTRLLAGADEGDYGVKATAKDGALPPKPDRADQPLQYRPSAAYVPADASGDGGALPGGAATVAVLVLLAAFAGQAIVLTVRRERRRLRARR